MRICCPRCKEWVPEVEARQHTLDQCKAAAKSFLLLTRFGLRPFPVTHSLPEWIPIVADEYTRAAYNGEPRAEQKLLALPERQLWVERWVDVVVTLWVGAIHFRGPTAKVQRDVVLRHLLMDAPLQRKVVDAHREDLRAVRDYLRPFILGPLPPLVSEVDKLQGLPS